VQLSRLRVLVLLATLALSACVASPAPTPVPSPSRGTPANPDAQASVDAALAQAAAHLGVSPADLRVEQVEARQWPDSSLGCPQPGLMYSQIVTPGFLIVISGGGAGSGAVKQLEYHSDARGNVVLCQER
jgi:hypothetical protein